MQTLQRICVFCGSKTGKLPIFREQAIALGQAMVSEGIGLVYGGGSVGLMGIIAQSILAAKGEVIGVIPKALNSRERIKDDVTQLFLVDTMHERKALMAEHADAFIAMPGGYGTLEELFEVITWLQLGIHSKPVGILNVGGYYDALIAMIDHGIENGFIAAPNRALIQVNDRPADLIAQLRNFDHSQFPTKWQGLAP